MVFDDRAILLSFVLKWRQWT